MFGLQAQVSDHEVRLAALESRTVSGVPETTIAERFTSLHERVDAVATNLLDKIDERFNQLSAQMDVRFEQVDQRFERMDDQLGEIKSMLLSLGATAPADRVN